MSERQPSDGDSGHDEASESLTARGVVILGLLVIVVVAVQLLEGRLGWPSVLRIATAVALLFVALSAMSTSDVAAALRLVDTALKVAWQAVGFAFALLGPLLVLGVVRLIPEIAFSPLRYLALVAIIAGLVLLIPFVWHDKSGSLTAGGNFFTGLWIYCGVVAALAVGGFTALTWEFYRQGLVRFDDPPTGPGQVADFYLYHLVNAMPFNITGAFHLRAPLDYQQARMGWVILIFTALVVGAVVHYATAQLQQRGQAKVDARAKLASDSTPAPDRRRNSSVKSVRKRRARAADADPMGRRTVQPRRLSPSTVPRLAGMRRHAGTSHDRWTDIG